MVVVAGTTGAGVEAVNRSATMPVADGTLGNAVVVDVIELADMMTVLLAVLPLSEVGGCCGGSGCDGSIDAMSYDNMYERKNTYENQISNSANKRLQNN